MVSAGRVVDRHGAGHLGGKCQGGPAPSAVWQCSLADARMLMTAHSSEFTLQNAACSPSFARRLQMPGAS